MKSSATSASSFSRPHSEVFLSTREESIDNTADENKLQNREKSGEEAAHAAAVGRRQEQQTIFVGPLTNKQRDQISGAIRHAGETVAAKDDTELSKKGEGEQQPKSNKEISTGNEGFSACVIATNLGTITTTHQSTCTSASSPLSSSSVPMPFPFHTLSSPCPSSLQQDFQDINERERELGVGAAAPTTAGTHSSSKGGGQDSVQCRCAICRGDGYTSKLEIVSFAGTSGRLFALSKRRGVSPSLPKENSKDNRKDERKYNTGNSIRDAHDDNSRLGGNSRQHAEEVCSSGSCGSVLEWVHNRHAFLPSSHEALKSARAEHDRLANRKKSKSSKVSESVSNTATNNTNSHANNNTAVSSTLSPPGSPSSLTSPASSSPRSSERRYHGIFGVYTLGQVSFLILIKSVAAVATGVPQYGSIFRITGLELMELPRHRSAGQQGQQRGGEGKRNNQTGASSPSFTGAVSSLPPPTARCQLGKESLERYRRMLERFCNVSDFAGGSALYTSYESSMTMRLGPLRQHEPLPTSYTSHTCTTEEGNKWTTRIERQASNTTDGDGDREGPMHRVGTFIDSEAYQEALANEIYRRAYSFQWNEPRLWLSAFDTCPTWLVPPIIRGYVGRDVVYIPPRPSPTTAVSSSSPPLASSSFGDRAHSSAPLPASANSSASGIAGSFIDIALVTRLSPRRAGTRYCRRGIDKPPQGSPQGFVANFSETEQIVWSVKNLLASSHVTVRGSAPVLWSQRADLRIVPRITIEGEMDPTASSVDDHLLGGRSSMKKKGTSDGGGGGVGGNTSGYDYPNEWGDESGGGGGGGGASDPMEMETFEGHLSVMAHMRYLSSLYADRSFMPSDTTMPSGSSDEGGEEGDGGGGEACVHGFKKASLRCKICNNEMTRCGKKDDLPGELSPTVSVGHVPSFTSKSMRPLRFIFLNLLGRREQEGRLSSHLRIAIRKHNSESKKVALSLRVSGCHLDLNKELKAALPSLFKHNNKSANKSGALRQHTSLGAVCAEYDSAFYRATESIQIALGSLVPDWGNMKVNCWPLLPRVHSASRIEAASEDTAGEAAPQDSIKNGVASHTPLLQGLARMKLGPSTSRQDVLFRINCLDCLDRSNIAQCCISMQALRSQVRSITAVGGERGEGCSSHHPSDLGCATSFNEELGGTMADTSYCASELAALAVSWSARKLWVALGDELALLYTGTRAHGATVLLPLPQPQPHEVSLCGPTAIRSLRRDCDSPSRAVATDSSNISAEQTKEPSERQRQGRQQGLIDAIQKVAAARLAFFYRVSESIPPVVAGVQTAMNRWINNNFYDAQKQDVVSLVVGDHIPYNQKAELPTFGPNAVFTINIVAVLALYALCVAAMVINTILFLFDALPTHTWAAVESGWIGVLLTLLILTLTRGSGVIVTLPTLYENRVGGVELDRSG